MLQDYDTTSIYKNNYTRSWEGKVPRWQKFELKQSRKGEGKLGLSDEAENGNSESARKTQSTTFDELGTRRKIQIRPKKTRRNLDLSLFISSRFFAFMLCILFLFLFLFFVF